MKARKIYGLLGGIAALAMCATAFAQDGPPPRDDQSGPPQERMGGGPGGPGGMRGPGGQGFGGPGMGGPRMGMRRMGGPGLEPLVLRPDVAKELKLSDSQVKKLKALFPRPDRMNGMRGGPGGMGMRQ